MRRIVATLLVVASPGLMAVPAGAGERRGAMPAVPTAALAVPAPVSVAVPATPEVVAPAAPVPVAVTPAVPAPAKAVATAVRPVARTVKAKAPALTEADDAVYAARLQAELCRARAVFCGLDRSGRYPAG